LSKNAPNTLATQVGLNPLTECWLGEVTEPSWVDPFNASPLEVGAAWVGLDRSCSGGLHRNDDNAREGSGTDILGGRGTGPFDVSCEMSRPFAGMQQRVHFASSNQGTRMGR